MLIAVIADIHSNLEALQSVLGRISDLGVDDIVCLGDIVGYNADPNECVSMIRERNITALLGNHDACASGLEEPVSFNAAAWKAVLWTREVLTRENRSFLAHLHRERAVRGCYLFHGSIHNTNRYILSKRDARDNFRMLEGLEGEWRIGFFGHTHMRTALSKEGETLLILDSRELRLSKESRYLINPGSVGQPRDDDPRAAFLVYDSIDRKVTYYRVSMMCGNVRTRSFMPACRHGWRTGSNGGNESREQSLCQNRFSFKAVIPASGVRF